MRPVHARCLQRFTKLCLQVSRSATSSLTSATPGCGSRAVPGGPHLPLASVPRASVGLGPCRRRMGRSGPWLLLTVSSRASFAVGTVAGEDPEHGGQGRGGKGRRLDSRIRPSGRHDPRPVREPGAGLLSPVLSVLRLSHQKGCPGGPACALPLRVRSFGAKIRPEDGRGLATAPPPPSSLQGLALSPVGPPGSRRVKCHKA